MFQFKNFFHLLLVINVGSCLAISPTTINARSHTRYRVHSARVIKMHHWTRHSHTYYLFGTHKHPAYVFNWQNLKQFKNYGEAFRARDDVNCLPIKITGRVKIGNLTFKRIRCSKAPVFNGWVASGTISNNPRHGHYYHFNGLVRGVLNSEINEQAPRLLNQLKAHTKYDLNQDRLQHHIPRLQENQTLDQLAKIRAHQIINNFSHYDQNGTPETTDDATQVGLSSNFMASENIATVGMGQTHLRGDNVKYNNRNGNDMANTDNNGMMYHDALEHNGHRQNILDPNSTLVGIGTAYNPRNQTFYLAEDFGNHDHTSSEDVN